MKFGKHNFSTLMSKRQADEDAKPKKVRILDSRNILRNNKDPALSEGVLNGPKFVEARQNEIKTLDRAMVQARAAGRQRAFQTLPRVLRRRTASHNVKRIPKRLREKAKREMDDDKTPSLAKGKSVKRGYAKAKAMAEERKLQHIKNTDIIPPLCNDNIGVDCSATPPKGRPKFQKRQVDKVWLPTHVWQVKRAHMINKWGYSIAETPHEKSYRAMHRAATCKNDTFAWDSSYYGSILVFAPEVRSIKYLVDKLTAPCSNSSSSQSAHCPKYNTGKRAWEGPIYDIHEVFLGPGLIYYCPTDPENPPSFKILIRVHPAIFGNVIEVIDSVKQQGVHLQYHDARYALGSLDIVGNKAFPSLFGAIKPVDSALRNVWKTLSNLSNVSSIPDGAVLSLDVNDPRLAFPPERKLCRTGSTVEQLEKLTREWPELLWKSSSNGTFSRTARQLSYERQATTKDLNRRKGSNSPGQDIKPDPKIDPSIPLIIIKRHGIDMMTLIAPWGWILPLWLSIVHLPDVRVGGMVQQQQYCFERGKPHFPVDFPQTRAGQLYNQDLAQLNRQLYERKPPNKRISYDRVATGDETLGEHGNPFASDWQFLASLYAGETSQTQLSGTETTQNRDNGLPLLPLQGISLQYVSRGHARDYARIYRVPEQSRSIWMDSVKPGFESTALPLPNKTHLIGYVTSGNYNLSCGVSTARGSIILPSNDDDMCIVRNVGSSKAYLARWRR